MESASKTKKVKLLRKRELTYVTKRLRDVDMSIYTAKLKLGAAFQLEMGYLRSHELWVFSLLYSLHCMYWYQLMHFPGVLRCCTGLHWPLSRCCCYMYS